MDKKEKEGIRNGLNEAFKESINEDSKVDFEYDFKDVISYLIEETKKISESLPDKGINSRERIINSKKELLEMVEMHKLKKELKSPNSYTKNMVIAIDAINNLFHSCIEKKKEFNKDEDIDENKVEEVKELSYKLAFKKVFFMQKLSEGFKENNDMQNYGVNIGIGYDKRNFDIKNRDTFVVDIAGTGQLSWHITSSQAEVLKEKYNVCDYNYEIAMDDKTNNKGLILSNYNDKDLKEHQKVVINSNYKDMNKNLKKVYSERDCR